MWEIADNDVWSLLGDLIVLIYGVMKLNVPFIRRFTLFCWFTLFVLANCCSFRLGFFSEQYPSGYLIIFCDSISKSWFIFRSKIKTWPEKWHVNRIIIPENNNCFGIRLIFFKLFFPTTLFFKTIFYLKKIHKSITELTMKLIWTRYSRGSSTSRLDSYLTEKSWT